MRLGFRDAEQDIKERSDKVAKNILVQAMQRIAGDYVAEQTNSTVHLPDDKYERVGLLAVKVAISELLKV